MKREKRNLLILGLFAVILALIYLYPFILILINSFKPMKDLVLDPAALPHNLYLKNYEKAYKVLDFAKAFGNSLLVTIPSVLGLSFLTSLAAYRLARRNKKVHRIIYFLLVASMVVPFQSFMVALVSVANKIGLYNSIPGIYVIYFGTGCAFNVFLYHGFIKSIPLEIEEAAIIDGCSPFGIYWKIILTLIRPIMVTVILLNTLWIWNDFLLPLLVLPTKELATIPLAINKLFGQYAKQWDLALAALVMTAVPIVIAFITMQKQIIKGVVEGSVKG